LARFLSLSRYLTLLAVVALLVTALAAFGWGIIKTVDAAAVILSSGGLDSAAAIAIIEVVDAFLISAGVLIFALGIYELFIGELNLPEGIQVHTWHDLKAKLGGILVLVMAVKFLEKVVEWKNGLETLYFALAIAVIAAVLIGFSVLGGKD
jgi:uncharacterized membrane protein YqhA